MRRDTVFDAAVSQKRRLFGVTRKRGNFILNLCHEKKSSLDKTDLADR